MTCVATALLGYYCLNVAFTVVLHGLQALGKSPGPSSAVSSFVDWHEIRSPRWCDESKSNDTDDQTRIEVQSLFERSFITMGYIPHTVQIMAWHPAYLQHFLDSYECIVLEEGALEQTWRYFIAMMAAARHGCQYLVKRYELEFLTAGGDADWLRGLAESRSLPRKLANLAEINALLAHRPWALTKDTIASLVKGDEAWSMSELVHAIVLMCTFHSLASFVLGMGIGMEPDISLISLWERTNGDDSSKVAPSMDASSSLDADYG